MRDLLRQSPLLAEALQLFSRGAYPQAIGLLQKAVAASPSQPEPRLQLAKACLDWVQIQAGIPLTEVEPGKLDAAALHYLQLAQSQMDVLAKSHPSMPHVQNLLAMLHLVYSRPEEALRCLKKAQIKSPRDPDVLYNMGYALMAMERHAEASAQFARLTALHPQHGMGWQMLGQARLLCGSPESAADAYERAKRLLPNLHQPFGGLANALLDMGRHGEAMDVLREGLKAHPAERDLNFSLADLALSVGDWTTGWRYYPCRKAEGPVIPPFPEGYVFPLRQGEPLRVHYDQGLGDELFFLRFARKLESQGIKIHYVTHPKLFPLLQGRTDIAELKRAEPGEIEPHDVLVGDLPFVAGMSSTPDIPPPLALSVDAGKAELLREELEAFGPAPYLGVTWQGGVPKARVAKGNWRGLHKEISPASLGNLARDWPGTVVVLQRLPKAEDMETFSGALARPFLDWSRLNDDLSDALAGLSLLDEYVGVSNTNMHLLAGIGKTARVLAPYPAEWRWMAEGEESPWFPGFKVYRQSLDNDWSGALSKLAKDLKEKYSPLEGRQ